DLLHSVFLRAGAARGARRDGHHPRALPPPTGGRSVRRAAALLMLLASACSMEPALVRPDPAIPQSWPIGDPYVAQAEVGLPVLTYKQVFTDPRLQTLIAEALVNNRDLMVAASNIAAAREQYVIQRANQLPTVDASGGATISGDKSSGSGTGSGSGSGSGSGTGSGSGSGNSSGNGVSARYDLGVSVPNFELDLFGRLRSLTHVQLQRVLATEAGARETCLTLVGNIANAWPDHAA